MPTNRKPGEATTKQTVLLAGLAAGMKQCDAGALAGFASPQSTNDAVRRMADRVASILDKVGLTEDYIAAELKKTVEADRTETAQYKGQITDMLVLPDWPVRLRGLETVMRLRRWFPSATEDSEDGKPTVAVQIVTNVKLDSP